VNCWGAGISDVSVLVKLPNIEVLSLSVNCISSLQHFSTCSKLRELYLRKNEIEDLTQVSQC
jgi:cilla- and flagella-associated protein